VSERLEIAAVAKAGYATVQELESYVRGRVDPEILGLVKVRASMLNECAFCVDLHSREWLRAGGSSRRLSALAVWRDTPLFTER
jgi:AhpD family alkylhydroperoxidase